MRARISAVNGEGVDYQQKEVRQQQGQIGREFAITYRPNLEENETVISGAWWPADKAGEVPEVSVEETMADTLKVAAGDSMTEVKNVVLDRTASWTANTCCKAGEPLRDIDPF